MVIGLRDLIASPEVSRAYKLGYQHGRRDRVETLKGRIKKRPSGFQRRAAWFFRRSDIAAQRGDFDRALKLEEWAIRELEAESLTA